MTEFRNGTQFEFSDISSEEYREYDFGTTKVRLVEPLKLHVSASGGHRVFTADGMSHYVPTGWLHLTWKVKPDAPHFDL